MNYRKALALGLSIGLIASGILIASLALVSRAHAEPAWVTEYGGPDGYCNGLKSGGSTYNCSSDYGAASAVFPLGTQLLVCFDECATVVIDDTCGSCFLDLDMAPAADIGLPGASTIEVTLL